MYMQQNASFSEVEDLVSRLLRQALGSRASVDLVCPSGPDSGVDLLIQLDDGPVLSLEIKTLDTPRLVHRQSDASELLVVRRATRRLHDELRRAGLNFVDTTGTVHLSLRNILVDRTNLRVPMVRGAVRQSFDPFSDRGSMIVRKLLETPPGERTWGVRELATEAGVSPATATRVVREIADHGVHVARRGRSAEVRLLDAHALFTAWTQVYDWTRNPSVAFNAPMGDPVRFFRQMAKAWNGPRWALGLHAGASRVAPIATWTRAHLYVDVPDAAALIGVGEAQGWEVAEGGNVVLLKPWYRRSVWHGLQQAGGLPVVSSLQLALDLWHYPLRGREQAEHLVENVVLRSVR
jgi:hypothetical protein